MSKAFDTINIHTLIRKLPQTNIPDTIMKFIANYTKVRKAYTAYRNHTSIQYKNWRSSRWHPLTPTIQHLHGRLTTTQGQQVMVNKRRNSWLPTMQPWHRLWSMPLPYGRHFHHRSALTNWKSCITPHCGLPYDAHKTQTYIICMTKHSYFPYTSTYRIQTQNTTSVTSPTQTYNILQHSKVKNTIFNNGHYRTNIPREPHTVTTTDIKTNMRHIHTSIASSHTRGNNKILRTPPPHISSSAQRRTNKSPFIKSYLNKGDAKSHPSPLCPLCNIHTHNTHHIFNCTHICTTLSPLDLWTNPAGVTTLLARWKNNFYINTSIQSIW